MKPYESKLYVTDNTKQFEQKLVLPFFDKVLCEPKKESLSTTVSEPLQEKTNSMYSV